MGDAPEQPADIAGQRHAAALDHRRTPADGRQIAFVTIGEVPAGGLAGGAVADQGRHMGAHLLGRGRDARHRLAIGAGNAGRVADREDLRMSGHAQIG